MVKRSRPGTLESRWEFFYGGMDTEILCRGPHWGVSRLWKECPSASWLLCFAAQNGVDKRYVIAAAVACAQAILPLVHGGFERMARQALEASIAWTQNHCDQTALACWRAVDLTRNWYPVDYHHQGKAYGKAEATWARSLYAVSSASWVAYAASLSDRRLSHSSRAASHAAKAYAYHRGEPDYKREDHESHFNWAMKELADRVCEVIPLAMVEKAMGSTP